MLVVLDFEVIRLPSSASSGEELGGEFVFIAVRAFEDGTVETGVEVSGETYADVEEDGSEA